MTSNPNDEFDRYKQILNDWSAGPSGAGEKKKATPKEEQPEPTPDPSSRPRAKLQKARPVAA